MKNEDDTLQSNGHAAEPSHEEASEQPEEHYEEQPSFASEHSLSPTLSEHAEPDVKSDPSEIESYDDAYVDDNETLDSENIRVSMEAGEASFAITPVQSLEVNQEAEEDTTHVLPASPEPLSEDEKHEEVEEAAVANGNGSAATEPTEDAEPALAGTEVVETEVAGVEVEVEEPTPIATVPSNGVLHFEEDDVPSSEAPAKVIAPVDELESMVNMLELGGPKRPPSDIESVPDVTGSIPDEE